MIRRWLRGCLLPSALCLAAVGCTPSVESLTGGLVTTEAPAPKESAAAPPARHDDDLPVADQVRLSLDAGREMDKAGNDDGALDQYERVLALDPSNFTALRRLCVLYDRRGGKDDFKKAEELYRKVAKVRPNDADVWSDWGYSLYLRTDKENCKDNWAEAEKKLRRALQLNPQHARAHSNLGLVLGQMGRYDEAYREFRAAQLDEAEAHCDLAFVYWTKGQLEEAKQECRVAREKDPACAKARDLLATLEKEPHRRDDAKAGRGGRGASAARRADALTPADWEAEREAARKAVAERIRAVQAGGDKGASPWQSPEMTRTLNSAGWMPVTPGAPPAPPPAAPAPAPGGTTGTVTFGDN
jgi:Flp pilus assembly protein TadD